MITFKQYLEESRSAPLYHGTTIDRASMILRDGGFMTLTTHQKWKMLKGPEPKPMEGDLYDINIASYNQKVFKNVATGVSATRSYRFAYKWAIQISKNFVIFEFDQLKLTHNHEIVPLNYWQMTTGSLARQLGDVRNPQNEFEEFILVKGGRVLPIKYVKAIHYHISDDYLDHVISEYFDIVSQWKSKYPQIKFIPIKGSVTID